VNLNPYKTLFLPLNSETSATDVFKNLQKRRK
jgi:hypothetical protein